MVDEQWLGNRVLFIKGLKNPSLMQQTLVQLVEIPVAERSAKNVRDLNTLIKAERAADRAASAQRAARKIVTEDQAKKRKERTHRLIQLGVLFEIAGLEKLHTSSLLGVLLKVADTPPDDPKWAVWASLGQIELDRRQGLRGKGDNLSVE